MTIREILNKIFWDSRYRKENYEIIFLHRGANRNRRIIPFERIKNIQPSWFIYIDEKKNEIIIPFHRILEIRNVQTGEFIWRKSKRNFPHDEILNIN